MLWFYGAVEVLRGVVLSWCPSALRSYHDCVIKLPSHCILNRLCGSGRTGGVTAQSGSRSLKSGRFLTPSGERSFIRFLSQIFHFYLTFDLMFLRFRKGSWGLAKYGFDLSGRKAEDSKGRCDWYLLQTYCTSAWYTLTLNLCCSDFKKSSINLEIKEK